jgi:hypothetical protein
MAITTRSSINVKAGREEWRHGANKQKRIKALSSQSKARQNQVNEKKDSANNEDRATRRLRFSVPQNTRLCQLEEMGVYLFVSGCQQNKKRI